MTWQEVYSRLEALLIGYAPGRSFVNYETGTWEMEFPHAPRDGEPYTVSYSHPMTPEEDA